MDHWLAWAIFEAVLSAGISTSQKPHPPSPLSLSPSPQSLPGLSPLPPRLMYIRNVSVRYTNYACTQFGPHVSLGAAFSAISAQSSALHFFFFFLAEVFFGLMSLEIGAAIIACDTR